MATYVVKQGDYLSKIAQENGVRSWKTLWDDPDNAELKQKRANPNVLYPGDKVHIPDPEEKNADCPTEQHHKFKAKVDTLKLRIRILDPLFKPVDDGKVRLALNGDYESLSTDGKGLFEKLITSTTTGGHVIVKSDKLPDGVDAELAVGGLDPVDEVTGQIGRLNNLGYDAGPLEEPQDDAAKLRLKSAIEEFQCDNKLQVDGDCGPQTQNKLKEVHGC